MKFGDIKIHPANQTTDRLEQMATNIVGSGVYEGPFWHAEAAKWGKEEIERLRAENEYFKTGLNALVYAPAPRSFALIVLAGEPSLAAMKDAIQLNQESSEVREREKASE